MNGLMNNGRGLGTFSYHSVYAPLNEHIDWLDRYITEDLIQHYVYLANRGNYTAIRTMDTLKLRIAKAQEQQQQLENN